MNTYKGVSTFRWSSDSPDFTLDEIVRSIAPDGTENESIIRTGITFKGFCLFIVDKQSFKPDHEHCACVHDFEPYTPDTPKEI